MPWILHVQHTQTTRQAKLLPRSGSALRQSATRWTWQGTLYAFVVHTVAPSGDQSILLNTDLEAPSKGSLIWWHSVSGSLSVLLSKHGAKCCESHLFFNLPVMGPPHNELVVVPDTAHKLQQGRKAAIRTTVCGACEYNEG